MRVLHHAAHQPRVLVCVRACTGVQQRALAAMHGRTLVAEERELTGDRRAEEPERHAPGRTAVVGGAVRRQPRHLRSRKCFFAELGVRIFLPGGRPRGRCHVDRHARGIDDRLEERSGDVVDERPEECARPASSVRRSAHLLRTRSRQTVSLSKSEQMFARSEQTFGQTEQMFAQKGSGSKRGGHNYIGRRGGFDRQLFKQTFGQSDQMFA